MNTAAEINEAWSKPYLLDSQNFEEKWKHLVPHQSEMQYQLQYLYQHIIISMYSVGCLKA